MPETITTDKQARLHAYLYKNGSKEGDASGVTWSVTDESVITLSDSEGVETLARPVSVGNATVVAVSGTFTATFALTVTLAPPPVPDGPDELRIELVGVEPYPT